MAICGSRVGPYTLDGGIPAALLARERAYLALCRQRCSSGQHQEYERAHWRRLFISPGPSVNQESVFAVG